MEKPVYEPHDDARKTTLGELEARLGRNGLEIYISPDLGFTCVSASGAMVEALLGLLAAAGLDDIGEVLERIDAANGGSPRGEAEA